MVMVLKRKTVTSWKGEGHNLVMFECNTVNMFFAQWSYSKSIEFNWKMILFLGKSLTNWGKEPTLLTSYKAEL